MEPLTVLMVVSRISPVPRTLSTIVSFTDSTMLLRVSAMTTSLQRIGARELAVTGIPAAATGSSGE
jgi:hypothetical protein